MVMLVLAVYYAIALSIAGLERAFAIGILTGLLVFIPYVGFGLGLVLGMLAALLQWHGWPGFLAVLAVYGIGQLLENYVLMPWLVGDRIGLHPLAVIFALLAFGQLFGFAGVLLALPVSAALLVGLRHLRAAYVTSPVYVRRRIERRDGAADLRARGARAAGVRAISSPGATRKRSSALAALARGELRETGVVLWGARRRRQVAPAAAAARAAAAAGRAARYADDPRRRSTTGSPSPARWSRSTTSTPRTRDGAGTAVHALQRARRRRGGSSSPRPRASGAPRAARRSSHAARARDSSTRSLPLARRRQAGGARRAMRASAAFASPTT